MGIVGKCQSCTNAQIDTTVGLRTLFPTIRLKGDLPKNPLYPTVLKTLGDHIRKKRMDDGLLCIDVGEIIGVDGSSVAAWERGAYEVDIVNYPKVVTYLGYDPLYDNSGTFVAKIENYRRKHGLTFKDLGKHTGVLPNTISQIVQGKRNVVYAPTKEKLLKVIESSD